MESATRYFDGEWKRTAYCGKFSGRPGESLPVVPERSGRRDLGGLIFLESGPHRVGRQRIHKVHKGGALGASSSPYRDIRSAGDENPA